MENFGEYTVRGKVKRFYDSAFIQCANDAYLIGYMACDGAFATNRGFPFMSVNSTQEYIIREFREEYCPDSSVYFCGKKSSEKVNAINDVWEVRFPAKMASLWKNYGIFSKKIDRRLVGISNANFLPYMAGVIEADGFIGVTHRNDCRTPRLRFFITHQSEKFLADLQNKLEMFCVPTTLRQHGKNVFRLQAQNTVKNIVFLSKILQFLKNHKKRGILEDYLNEYVEPQASGELLESASQSAAKL